MTFKIFESNFHDYTLEDIKKLPGFLLLTAMGYYDSSTEIIKRHMNMRLYNKELGFDDPIDNVMVYSNGYVRRVTQDRWGGGRPRVMKKFDGEDTLMRWNQQFLYIYDWTLKQYKKKGINSKYGVIDKSEFTSNDKIIDYMVRNYSKNPGSIFLMSDLLNDEGMEDFLKKIKTDIKKFEDSKKKYKIGMKILNRWIK